MDKNKVLICDTETTGLTNHSTYGHPQIVELSTIKFDLHYDLQTLPHLLNKEDIKDHFDRYYSESMFNQLFKPSMPIHPEASKIHGKTLRDLINSPRSETAKLPSDAKYLIGHNIQYDYRCLGKPEGYLLIDTLVICKLIRKYTSHDLKAETNKLDDLLIALNPKQYQQFTNEGFHRSLDDCFKCLLIIEIIIKLMPNVKHWDDLYTLQELGKKK